MGSVKHFEEPWEEPTQDQAGLGPMAFTDNYSVFDWGKMPDEIPGKGAALCMMAAFNFEELARQGIDSHYLGLLKPQGKERFSVDTIERPTNRMLVQLARVIKPKVRDDGTYDYGEFQRRKGELNHFIVPLEAIYRDGAPAGSSMFKTIARLQALGEKGAADLNLLLGKYGLTKPPNPGDLFPERGINFTTKFEEKDRSVEDLVAHDEISGLSVQDWNMMYDMVDQTAQIIKDHGQSIGLVVYDGKFEFVRANDIIIADVCGTLDENRFFFNGEQVSKQFLRDWYRRHDPEWVASVDAAKEQADKQGVADWKSLVSLRPANLPQELPGLVGEMYKAAANLWVGRELFKARPLGEVMKDLRPYKGD